MEPINPQMPVYPLVSEDIMLPFQLESFFVRGRLVRLGPAFDQIVGKHGYPPGICKLLGQACAMAVAFGTALKFDGLFTLQARTDGPVRMLVVDVTSGGAVRACAQFDEDAIIRAQSEGRPLLGNGQLVFTVDQKETDERYQGVVELTGQSLTDAVLHYFKQSEQIPTGIVTAAQQDDEGHWHAACLMVQRMPGAGGKLPSALHEDTAVEDDWLRVMILMQTCTEKELTDPDLELETLLFRLFHEEGVRVFDAIELRHECRCSREKIKGVLLGMPKDELEEMVRERGDVSATCEYCSEVYLFTPAELNIKTTSRESD